MTRRLVCALALGVALVLSGCSGPPDVALDRSVGSLDAAAERQSAWGLSGGRLTFALVDRGFETPSAPAFTAFLGGRAGGVRYGVGDPAAITATVKDGERVDAVVLPAGPDLDRLANEFVFPAEPVGRIRGTTYWVGAVDMRGWALVTYLTGVRGRALLRTYGVQPVPAAAAPQASDAA